MGKLQKLGVWKFPFLFILALLINLYMFDLVTNKFTLSFIYAVIMVVIYGLNENER